jgi:hypothetical protein
LETTPSPKVNLSPLAGGTKSIFTSRTFAGLALIAVPPIAAHFGFKLDDAATQEIVQNCFQAVGLLVAAYGRLKASKTLVVPSPKSTALLFLSTLFALAAMLYLTACASTTRRGRVTNAVAITAAKFAGKVVISSVANLANERAQGLQLDYAHAASEALWANMDTIITADDVSRVVEAWTAPAPRDLAVPLAAQFAALAPSSPPERSAVVDAMAKGISAAALTLSPEQLMPLPSKGGLAK